MHETTPTPESRPDWSAALAAQINLLDHNDRLRRKLARAKEKAAERKAERDALSRELTRLRAQGRLQGPCDWGANTDSPCPLPRSLRHTHGGAVAPNGAVISDFPAGRWLLVTWERTNARAVGAHLVPERTPEPYRRPSPRDTWCDPCRAGDCVNCAWDEEIPPDRCQHVCARPA